MMEEKSVPKDTIICKGCGKPLSEMVMRMRSRPDASLWCREGYHSLSCFKQNYQNVATVAVLHLAVSIGDATRVKELLERGVDANVADDDGLTPLHAAAKNLQYGIANILLDYKADPNIMFENKTVLSHIVTVLIDRNRWRDITGNPTYKSLVSRLEKLENWPSQSVQPREPIPFLSTRAERFQPMHIDDEIRKRKRKMMEEMDRRSRDKIIDKNSDIHSEAAQSDVISHENDTISQGSLISILRSSAQIDSGELPDIPDGWTTLTSLVFLMHGAAYQQQPQDDVVRTTIEVARITKVDPLEINKSNKLALNWGQQVLDTGGPTLLPSAYMHHATVVLSLGLDFLRSEVLPGIRQLANQVGDDPTLNNFVVRLCSTLWNPKVN